MWAVPERGSQLTRCNKVRWLVLLPVPTATLRSNWGLAMVQSFHCCPDIRPEAECSDWRRRLSTLYAVRPWRFAAISFWGWFAWRQLVIFPLNESANCGSRPLFRFAAQGPPTLESTLSAQLTVYSSLLIWPGIGSEPAHGWRWRSSAAHCSRPIGRRPWSSYHAGAADAGLGRWPRTPTTVPTMWLWSFRRKRRATANPPMFFGIDAFSAEIQTNNKQIH